MSMQENNKIVAYITETGGLISEHDYNFLSDGQKAKCKIYTPLPAPSSTPQSVEGMKGSLSVETIKSLYAVINLDGAIKEEDKLIYLFATIHEIHKALVGDKEREIEEWKHAADSFELTAKEFKKEIQFLNDRNEYWKARCLACERYSENSDYREENYEEWQALKQQPIK